MWSDILMVAERGFLVRILAWGALSVLAGTALLGVLATRSRRSRLLSHFAFQCIGWGILEIAIGGVLLSRIAPRDLDRATRLDRLLWLNAGLDAGYVAAGAAAAVTAWLLTRRGHPDDSTARGTAVIGGGIGVVVQGAALLALDLHFLSVLERLVYHG